MTEETSMPTMPTDDITDDPMTKLSSPQGTVTELLLMFGICVAQVIIIEVVGYFLIYHKEEFKDLQDKARNLGARIKKLKYEYLYVPSPKKK